MKQETRNRWQGISGGSQEELANCKNERCRRRENRDGDDTGRISEQKEEEQSILRSEVEGCCGDTRATQWPARPGEEQYEWEEPRVTEAQSCVGLSTYGTSTRVDELRLLGNGVVPQTAELAWKTLWKELNYP